jgi:peptidoglycan/xylan/chitin deacetylase (PgdA/CDA1 family)
MASDPVAAMKSALRFGLHRAGGLALIRGLRRSGIRILNYHRFPDPAAWERQCRHLRAHYRPITLRAAAAALRGEMAAAAGAVAITVDDGYRDFYTHAFPVLQRHGLPATVFLVTGFIDGSCWLWRDRVEYALDRTPQTALECDLLQAPLRNAAERRAASRRLIAALKTQPDAARRAFLDGLPPLLEVEIPPRPTADYEPLRWEDIREMSRHGIDFGAHSLTHPILPRVESRDVLYREIAEPKQRIEDELGEAVEAFCYPNGDWDQRCLDAVKQAGYRCALTTRWGRNLHPPSPFLLERTPAGADWPDYFFREVVAYGYPWRAGEGRESGPEPS